MPLIKHTREAMNNVWKDIQNEISINHLAVREKPIIERYKAKLVSKGFCEILIPIK
ncbi:hypothetical protein ACFSUE_17695 [Sporolactobacillus shoreicorticis]|uniref:Uncharacterized protein n=1 Tax=Sporolactobacillus shoreicorticis TaxID=1923877 RepID=A0ABW5S9R2_9BACL